MTQGRFIVLDGTDGSGTTSQSLQLAETLRKRGLSVHTTHEPSEGPIGKLLRQILTDQVKIAKGGDSPLWSTMALLFTADRFDHIQTEIIPNLVKGTHVICDRYYYSTLAYQFAIGVKSGVGHDIASLATITSTIFVNAGCKWQYVKIEDWLRGINEGALCPDLTIVLDVDPSVASERRRARNKGVEIYEEQHDLQEALCDIYSSIERYFPREPIHHVNANLPFEQVASDILELVRPTLM